MPLSLPTEVWIQIVRIAVTKWPQTSFNPHSDNLAGIDGFRKASPHFQAVVDCVRYENFVGNYDQFIFLDSPCHLVQYLRIREMLPIGPLLTKAFHDSLSDYSQLKSLSICSPEPLATIMHLQSLSFSSTLKRLDFRIYPEGRFSLDVPVSFPHLVELRLGAREYLKAPSQWSIGGIKSPLDLCSFSIFAPEDFASNLAKRLSGSQNLRLISIHVSFDDEQELRALIALHDLNIYRTMSDQSSPVLHKQEYFSCTTCTKTYDHDAVIRRENAATLILAQSLLSLERVLWTDAWRTIAEDESAQRGITIVREGQNIELVRDS